MATWCMHSDNLTVKNNVPYHLKKIIVRYGKIGYNTDVLYKAACLVVKPIKVNNYAYLFDNTTVDWPSDGMTVSS